MCLFIKGERQEKGPTSKGTEGRERRREGTVREGKGFPKVKMNRINTAKQRMAYRLLNSTTLSL